MGKKTSEWKYGEPKEQRQFTLTRTASNIIDQLAEDLGLSRSEFLEQLVRGLKETWGNEENSDISGQEISK